jgi:hypothetical protein
MIVWQGDGVEERGIDKATRRTPGMKARESGQWIVDHRFDVDCPKLRSDGRYFCADG